MQHAVLASTWCSMTSVRSAEIIFKLGNVYCATFHPLPCHNFTRVSMTTTAFQFPKVHFIIPLCARQHIANRRYSPPRDAINAV
ncbi:hypothetical protein EDC04DRAFT_226373 [Pisolithus marmoratus]|nr:hypothetical protein EDC04DRAFT_226373 [Pisolithus marmoratus]